MSKITAKEYLLQEENCNKEIIQVMEEYAALKVKEEKEWISVEDRLPENKSKVLVSCEHGVTMAEFTSFTNGNVMWWAATEIGTYEDSQDAKKVTHWMLLPELLKPVTVKKKN